MDLPSFLLATNFRTIGLAVAFVVLIAFIALIYINTVKAKEETGSEIELAANRKEYYKDEELEGKRLDLSLTFALVMLSFISITFGFYMVAEPGRQDGAVAAKEASFESRGQNNYVEGAQCVNCHAADGSGGGAAYVLQDADGQFVANATWTAPAINNVLLRYSEEEVEYILNYGRTGSPMAAWGTPGGGPLTEQAVLNTIAYIKTLQVQSLDKVDIAAAGNDNPDNNVDDLEDEESREAQQEANKLTVKIREEVARSIDSGEFKTEGEAVFNLGLYSGFGAGSLSCGRCHTAGWSLGVSSSPQVLEPGIAGCGGGVSGIGFNLCGDSLQNRFPDDTWKMADGSWQPEIGLFDEDGNQYIENAAGGRVMLDDRGSPVDDNGDTYIILTSSLSPKSENEKPVEETDSETEDSLAALGSSGDLAKCEFVSGLFTPAEGATYAVDPNATPTVDAEGEISDPVELDTTTLNGTAYELNSGRIVAECDVIEMPERTSQAQYNFIYSGADKGKGYGVGGQSSAGMMPGFGKILPPEYIQAVVDYERSLE